MMNSRKVGEAGKSTAVGLWHSSKEDARSYK